MCTGYTAPKTKYSDFHAEKKVEATVAAFQKAPPPTPPSKRGSRPMTSKIQLQQQVFRGVKLPLSELSIIEAAGVTHDETAARV